jgi:hypothetical protein
MGLNLMKQYRYFVSLSSKVIITYKNVLFYNKLKISTALFATSTTYKKLSIANKRTRIWSVLLFERTYVKIGQVNKVHLFGLDLLRYSGE